MALACPGFAARQWHARRAPASSLPFGPPSVDIRPSGQGRGLGLFASRAIPRFFPITAEVPLVLMKPSDDLPELYARFLHLSLDARKRYLDLGSAENPERDAILEEKLQHRTLREGFGDDGLEQVIKVAGIMQTNAFNVDLHDGQGSNHRALFASIARINHSCMPNAHVCFYPASGKSSSGGRMYVHTLRALEAGEEVLISYFDILLPREQRQAKTKKWGFQCECSVCTEDTGSSDGVSLEDQRKYLREWLALEEQCMSSPRMTADHLQTVLGMGRTLLDNAEINASLTPAFPKMLDGLAMLQAKYLAMQRQEHDRSELLSLLEQSAIWEAKITGADSHATAKRLDKLQEFSRGQKDRQAARIEQDEDESLRIVWT